MTDRWERVFYWVMRTVGRPVLTVDKAGERWLRGNLAVWSREGWRGLERRWRRSAGVEAGGMLATGVALLVVMGPLARGVENADIYDTAPVARRAWTSAELVELKKAKVWQPAGGTTDWCADDKKNGGGGERRHYQCTTYEVDVAPDYTADGWRNGNAKDYRLEVEKRKSARGDNGNAKYAYVGGYDEYQEAGVRGDGSMRAGKDDSGRVGSGWDAGSTYDPWDSGTAMPRSYDLGWSDLATSSTVDKKAKHYGLGGGSAARYYSGGVGPVY